MQCEMVNKSYVQGTNIVLLSANKTSSGYAEDCAAVFFLLNLLVAYFGSVAL